MYGGIHIVCPIVPVIHWQNKPNHWGNQYPQFLEVAGPSGCVWRANTKKCRFMDERMREISRFFVAPPRVFPLSVRTRPRTVLSTNTYSLVLRNYDQKVKVRGFHFTTKIRNRDFQFHFIRFVRK